MAYSNVYMSDTDGNIPVFSSNAIENVCGLVFDISGQSDFWTTGAGATLADKWKDTVVELNSLSEAVEAGITAYSATASNNVLAGIPYYHISQFFKMTGGSGRLFVMFADCSSNWNALIEMQRAANGAIFQMGVWTEQNLWVQSNESATQYSMSFITDLNNVAKEMADDYFAPVSILLSANTSKVMVGDKSTSTIAINKIPSCVSDARYVSVLLSQAQDDTVHKMQGSLTSTAPVGCVGLALGVLAKAGVGESIGWVGGFNLVDCVNAVEMGFGDSTLTGGVLTNPTSYNSLTHAQLGALEEAGYIFMRYYEGMEDQVSFVDDSTCSNGDFCTIARNRAIHKSRRLVRLALLPYVNSPLKVDPSNGNLSSAQVTIFKNLVTDILSNMETSSEISAIGTVTVPADQNVLVTKKLNLSYSIIPMGCAKSIYVETSLAVTQS